MVACAGPLATRNCESRQVRKEATAAVDVCAGVGTVRVASNIYSIIKSTHMTLVWIENPKRFAGKALLMYDA